MIWSHVHSHKHSTHTTKPLTIEEKKSDKKKTIHQFKIHNVELKNWKMYHGIIESFESCQLSRQCCLLSSISLFILYVLFLWSIHKSWVAWTFECWSKQAINARFGTNQIIFNAMIYVAWLKLFCINWWTIIKSVLSICRIWKLKFFLSEKEFDAITSRNKWKMNASFATQINALRNCAI